jgi:hypothetical protein
MVTNSENPREKLRYVQRIRGIKSADLARACGITTHTLRTIACGASKSRKARQKISNLLCATIWLDIRPETALATIPRGAVFSKLTHSLREFAAEFPGHIKILNQHSIRVTRPIDVILRIPARHAGATSETGGTK